MRKKFFIRYHMDFGNTYRLCYTEDGKEPSGWSRISRKEAIEKARAERSRRKDDPSFSGYADSYICPYGYHYEGAGSHDPLIPSKGECVKDYE